MGRIARRSAKMHDQAEGEGKLFPEELSEQENAPLTPTWAKLTPRQKQLQLDILSKRRSPNGGLR
jgi:hypothetical protein